MKIRVAIWFLLTVAAFAQSGPFAATGGNQSLFVNVNGGTAAISTTPTVIAAETVLLTANSTNYIYVDLSAGTITSNTTGFTTTTYPIATAVTNATLVTSLVDDRPSAFNVAGTGGAGTITGSGTPGSLPIWIASTTNLGNSNETEASNIFNVGTSGGMATSASGGLVFSGNLFSSTSVTVPTGYDFSIFTGSDNFFRCQLSVALGSGPCLNFSTIGGLASAAQIGDLSATYALQTQLTNAAQYSTAYYSAAGSANTLSGLSPAVTNGTWFPVQKVTASTAVAPVMQQFGMSTRSITGAATTDTVLYSDVGTVIAHDIAGSQSVTETLPTATTLANPNMVFSYANHSTHTDTITPTTWTIQVGTTAAAASMTVATGVTCRISVDANSATNWHADCANAAGAGGAVSSVNTLTGAVVIENATAGQMAVSGGGSAALTGAADMTYSTHTFATITTGIFDWSAATGLGAFKFPPVVGGSTLTGTVTAALSAPIVFQDTNSSNNNSSMAAIFTTPGTSTGQVGIYVNGATTGAALIKAGTGGTVASGAISGQTDTFVVAPNGTTSFGTAPTITTPGTGWYMFGTDGTEPASIAAGTSGFVSDSTSNCPIQWNNAANVGCSAALGVAQTFTATQTLPNIAFSGSAPAVTTSGTTPYLNMNTLVKDTQNTCTFALTTSTFTLALSPVSLCTYTLPNAAVTWYWQCSMTWSNPAGTTPTFGIGVTWAQAPSAASQAENIYITNGNGVAAGINFQASTATTTNATIGATPSLTTSATLFQAQASGKFTGSATSGTFSPTVILTGTSATGTAVGGCTIQ